MRRLTIRMSPELHARVVAMAARMGMSVNAFIVEAIRIAVEEAERKEKDQGRATAAYAPDDGPLTKKQVRQIQAASRAAMPVPQGKKQG